MLVSTVAAAGLLLWSPSGPPHAVTRVVTLSRAGAIVDSRMTPAQALRGSEAPQSVHRSLALVTVRYRSFDGRMHQGQILVHKALAGEVAAIFRELEKLRFPIARVVPVVRYGWSDARSMADNDSSGFNYRRKLGRRSLSPHASGRAIDINPMQNPYLHRGRRLPPGSRRDARAHGTIIDGPVVRAFTRRGWRWGGHFRHGKDWQHFDKTS